MSKIRKFSFLIHALFLFTTCASFNKELVMCGDCTKYNKGICIIKSDVDHVVIQEESLLSMGSSELAPLTADLDVCIPSNMTIDAQDGEFLYICVWSPELGCQMLIPKNNKDDFIGCGSCQMDEFVRIGCPCEKPVSDSGKFKWKSGSRQLYSRSLRIMIAAYFMQQAMTQKLCGL
ncbi:uncharacterized protein LOC119555521 [Drosophila subpulchrella]|uniref:uncharacterized protein LOC119555521 n=1 Tax=Drosophila subpulchrella TaxID=1486046 RepID=UPI0018A1B0F7|nr:uncharacterized protein LOC119555521 [Drosophila subpulchrella]